VTGNPSRRAYTPEIRAAALEKFRTDGADAASEQTGVPAGTIRTWANNDGVRTERETKATAAVAAARLSLEQRKTALADRLLDEANKELDLMREPYHEEKIVTLGGTPTTQGTWAVAEVSRDATPGERKTMMTTAAIAIDKVAVLTQGAGARFGMEPTKDPQVEETAMRIIRGLAVYDGGRGEAAS